MKTNKHLLDARIDLLEYGVKFGGHQSFKEDANQAVLQAARVLVEIDKVENSKQCKALFKFAKENPNDEDVKALKQLVRWHSQPKVVGAHVTNILKKAGIHGNK